MTREGGNQLCIECGADGDSSSLGVIGWVADDFENPEVDDLHSRDRLQVHPLLVNLCIIRTEESLLQHPSKAPSFLL